MFEELYEQTRSVRETSDEELRQIQREMGTPDARPQPFDVTFEAWLDRLDLWGVVNIYHFDPENRTRNKKVTQKQFISKVSDPELLKIFGTWDIKELKINKIALTRKYLGVDGKKYKEEFIVEIDLKPELKKALKRRWF